MCIVWFSSVKYTKYKFTTATSTPLSLKISSKDKVFLCVFVGGDLNSRTMDIFPTISNEDDLYEHAQERLNITGAQRTWYLMVMDNYC